MAENEIKTIVSSEADTSGINKTIEKTEELKESTDELSESTKDMGKQSEDAGSSLEKLKAKLNALRDKIFPTNSALSKLLRSMARIAFYRAIRTTLSTLANSFKEGATLIYGWSNAMNSLDPTKYNSGIHEFSDGLGGVAGNMNQIATCVQYVKTALGSVLAPVIQMVAPMVEWLSHKLVQAADALAQFMSAIAGNTSYAKAVETSAVWNKNLGGAAQKAKELKRTLLGFDEINRLNGDTPTSSGSGGGGGIDYSSLYVPTEISDKMKNLGAKIQENLDTIKLVVLGATLALGAIFLMTGNWGLGLALLALGVTEIVSPFMPKWGEMTTKTQQKWSEISTYASGLALALGLVLACTGNLPLGLGLMAVGAANLAYQATVNWNTLPDGIKETIQKVSRIIGGALFIIGMFLCAIGQLPLGIGLLVAGGVTLYSSIAPNWNSIVDGVKTTFSNVKNAISTKMDEIKTTIKDKWNGAIDHIKSAWSKINLKSFHIPTPHISWVSGGYQATGLVAKALSALGLSTSLPKLSVSWYAQGGIFSQPTILNNSIGVGDSVSPEVVAPLDDLRGMIADLLNISIEVPVEIDGEQVGKSAVKYNNNVFNQTGKSPLKI
mgnify:CR=1 FL=1